MPRGTLTPLLVVSIGNPSVQYANTLHSAGHTTLKELRSILKWEPWRPYMKGEISTPPQRPKFSWTGLSKASDNEHEPTLWMCGSYMNLSGPSIKRCWNAWRSGSESRKKNGKLVIVHDEMEGELGAVKVRLDPKLSAKGHNGIKSAFQALGNTPFIRIGIGIGRPQSREPKVVANYVLRKMTSREHEHFEEAAYKVMSVINDLKYDEYKS